MGACSATWLPRLQVPVIGWIYVKGCNREDRAAGALRRAVLCCVVLDAAWKLGGHLACWQHLPAWSLSLLAQPCLMTCPLRCCRLWKVQEGGGARRGDGSLSRRRGEQQAGGRAAWRLGVRCSVLCAGVLHRVCPPAHALPGMLTLCRSPMAGPTCFTPPTQTSPAPALRARPSGEAAPAARCCLIPALLPLGAALQPPNHCPSHCAVFCIVHCITAGMSKSTRRRAPPLAPIDGQAGSAPRRKELHPYTQSCPAAATSCCGRKPAHCAAHRTHPAEGHG